MRFCRKPSARGTLSLSISKDEHDCDQLLYYKIGKKKTCCQVGTDKAQHRYRVRGGKACSKEKIMVY